MSMQFGATEEDAVSEGQQSTPPVEEENPAQKSGENLPQEPVFEQYDAPEQEEGQETQEQEQDTESSPGVQKRIDQIRREKGDAERHGERGWAEADRLKTELDAIRAAETKEEVPKEKTIEYWQGIMRLDEYVNDIKVQQQCNVNIQRIIADEAVKADRDEQNKATARQHQHDITYQKMVALYPQYEQGSQDFNEAAAIFTASPVLQTLPDGIELAIYKHLATKSAPQLQEAQESQRETASKLKKEIQKSELGTSTRAAPKSKKKNRVQDEYQKFLKTGDAKELIKAKLNL